MEREQFPQVVHQSGQLQPGLIGMVPADPLGRLERVHYVRQRGVRVALINQSVQFFERLPDRQTSQVELEIFLMFTCYGQLLFLYIGPTTKNQIYFFRFHSEKEKMVHNGV